MELVNEGLVAIWSDRKANPTQNPQPRAQWPRVPSTPPTGFPGYDPGKLEFEPDMMLASPEYGDRLLTALLAGDFSAVWDALDGGQAPSPSAFLCKHVSRCKSAAG